MLVPVLAFAACGSDGDETAAPSETPAETPAEPPAEPASADVDSWTGDVCGALTEWQQDLQTSSTELGESLTDVEDLEAVRTVLADFLEGAVTRTEEMIGDIEAAGTPDIDQGEEISTDLQAVLTDVRDVFAEAQADAEDLPTDDATAFTAGATELASAIESGISEVGTTFDGLDEKYDAPELQEAFSANEACTALGSA